MKLTFIIFKLNTILAILFICSAPVLGQNTSKNSVQTKNKSNVQVNSLWDRKSYQSVKIDTFREEEVFNKNVDFSKMDYPLLNACVFYLTNEIRSKKNLPLMEYATELETAAWNHSKQMAEKKFFSHENPKERNRKSTDDRARLAGIANPFIAENIASRSGYEKQMTYLQMAEKFIKQWMESSGHKENILSKKALQLGCGVFVLKNECFATQCFQWFSKVKSQPAKDKLP